MRLTNIFERFFIRIFELFELSNVCIVMIGIVKESCVIDHFWVVCVAIVVEKVFKF